MKTNFVVSNCYDVWIPDVENLFMVNPFIEHQLELDGIIDSYKNIEIASLRQTNRQELENDHNLVDMKVRKYTKILNRRLDQIHNVRFGSEFWEKALSLALLRHTSMCHFFYQGCKENFDPSIHDCQVIDTCCYYIPSTFDDHRHFLQHTDFGQEQLFSVYCNIFYPKVASAIIINDYERPKGVHKNLFSRLATSNFFRKLFGKILENSTFLIKPNVGIIGSFFATKYRKKLLLESLGKIQLIKLPTIPISPKHTSHDMRAELTKFDNDFDDLDKFVFSALYHLMPNSFLENFDQYYVGYKKHFVKMKNLKWVVCESWIGDESSAMALAILKTLDVKHICNEHNYISHPFIGNSLKYQIPLVDEFISLGWSDSKYPNFLTGASLFEWDNGIKHKKEYDILLVLGACFSRSPETNAAYGDSGPYGAGSYVKMMRDFFQALGDKTLSQVYVRSYPEYAQANWHVWNQNFLFSDYIVKTIEFDDYSASGRELIGKARLVVINYLSTSHLESIISDIPTIFLWNKETYHHEDKYASIYDGLIESGICQTDPLTAANFINKIKGNPQLWWDSEAVQKSRKSFLKENFGEPDILVNHLLKKSNIKN